LAAVPAIADELPQTSNAWRAIQSEPVNPGEYRWSLIDDATGTEHPVPSANNTQERRRDAPARAAIAQIRAETARVMQEALQKASTVQRIRYDLHVSCVVEAISYEQDPLENASLPWLWESISERDRTVEGTVEMCEVDYSQKIRSKEPVAAAVAAPPKPVMQDFKVSFPVD
jgi:hypothetical protein